MLTAPSLARRVHSGDGAMARQASAARRRAAQTRRTARSSISLNKRAVEARIANPKSNIDSLPVVSPMPNVIWWISVNGEQRGPFSTATLKSWFAEGKIPPDALIRSDNGPWVLARKARLNPIDWQSVFNGVVLAAGVLLAVEVFWFAMSDPISARWLCGLLVAYVYFAARTMRREHRSDKK